ncbi:MAG: hypothetical protein IJU93_01800, partial [Lachnospiraceae bacterium]|nr:hypothetical protein [Lachnospiraceae bacterium]
GSPGTGLSESSFEVDTSSPSHSSGRKEGKQINMAVIIAAAVILAVVAGVIVSLRFGIKPDKDKGAAAEAKAEATEQTNDTLVETEDIGVISTKEEPSPAMQSGNDHTAETEESPEESSEKTEASTAPAASEESPLSDESGETTTASVEPASTPALEDFAWVDNGLPEDVTGYEDINKTEGRWKCMLHAITSTNGRGRILLSEADVQHNDGKVTLYLEVYDCYEYPFDKPEEKELVDMGSGAVMELRGEWDKSFGSIEASSIQSNLRVDINRFVENETAQYAMGDTYNSDEFIGYIYMIRP